jgi:hypothetical protein
MTLRRIGAIGFATALMAGALAFAGPADADWHHGHGWYHHWHGPVWYRPWAPPVYYAPPPVYYAPPPQVVYAPPPVYYPPAVSIGVRIP